jgi:NADH dehydrogenase
MLLLTGATGLVGRELLPLLLDAGRPVRCLVRDPRRLGPDRVRVQIALGDLADPPSFRNALRGVRTVVHLAQARRDQASGSIEELDGIATWRLAEAASRAGVERFVFMSACGASRHSRARFLRAKALAERAVADAPVPSTTIAPSLVYGADRRLPGRLGRLSLLPALPVPGRGDATFQPVWARDVAACAAAALEGDPPPRVEVCGPETLTRDDVLRRLLAAAGRPPRLLHVPPPLARAAVGAGELLLRAGAPLAWDELELLAVSAVCGGGGAGGGPVPGAAALGVTPRSMAEVLG